MKRHRKLIIFIAIIIVLALLNRHFGWSRTLGDTATWQAWTDYVRDHTFAASVIYIVLTIIGCVLLTLPGVTFAVIAGLLFGPWLGTLLCLIATTLGAVASFLAGRYFLQDSIKPLIKKNKWLDKLLFSDNKQNYLLLLLITRLIPLFPYNLQNFAYGITDIKLIPYTVYTFIFLTPGVAVFTIAAAGFMDPEKRVLYMTLAAVLLAVVGFAAWWIYRRYLERSSHAAENET